MLFSVLFDSPPSPNDFIVRISLVKVSHCVFKFLLKRSKKSLSTSDCSNYFLVRSN